MEEKKIVLLIVIITISLLPLAFANEIIGNIEIGTPNDIAINYNTNFIYLSDPKSQSLKVFDASTNKLIKEISLIDEPGEIAIDLDRNLIYVTNLNYGLVSVIDGDENKVLTDYEVGENIDGIAVNSKLNKVYVTHHSPGESSSLVSVLDLNSGKIKKIEVPDPFPQRIAVNPNNNEVYISNDISYNSKLIVINGNSDTIGEHIPLDDSPRTVKVNPITNTIYSLIAGLDSKAVLVIDGSSHNLIKKIPIGFYSWELEVDSFSNIVYVLNDEGKSITVVDGDSHRVLSTIKDLNPVGKNLAVNPFTGKLYVTYDTGFYPEMTIIQTDYIASSESTPAPETPISEESFSKIPEWVKNTMKWFVEGKISEDEMIQALQFLIKEGIIKV